MSEIVFHQQVSHRGGLTSHFADWQLAKSSASLTFHCVTRSSFYKLTLGVSCWDGGFQRDPAIREENSAAVLIKIPRPYAHHENLLWWVAPASCAPLNCASSIKGRSRITVPLPVAADYAALRLGGGCFTSRYLRRWGWERKGGRRGVQRSSEGWRPAHVVVQRLDAQCRFPGAGGPTATRSAPAVRCLGSTGFSLQLMIRTFLCGDWQHVRPDGVKCDTAAFGLHFTRIRRAGCPTLRRTLCSR